MSQWTCLFVLIRLYSKLSISDVLLGIYKHHFFVVIGSNTRFIVGNSKSRCLSRKKYHRGIFVLFFCTTLSYYVSLSRKKYMKHVLLKNMMRVHGFNYLKNVKLIRNQSNEKLLHCCILQSGVFLCLLSTFESRNEQTKEIIFKRLHFETCFSH